MTNNAEHAVHKLYQYRKSISTKPYASRGKNQIRCELCLLPQKHCTCEFRQLLDSNTAFLLIMYDNEVLKPSNSGRLIADLIPETHAYLWSRLEPAPQMLALIENPDYQPFVVFPAEYANEQQTVLNDLPPGTLTPGKTPLFILLDGSWREAKKIFRKSPYLHQLPLLCFTPKTLAKYGLRKNSRDFQLGTAEVGSLVLHAAGEDNNAVTLDAWFELFIESSIYARCRRRPGDLRPLNVLQDNYVASIEQVTSAEYY
ncbi:MAG: DTW domain-containing protein [Algicola sp.]|nr:DTW domain-containing protein [Algicola sp.]